jgi:hypothetical protein
MYDGSVGRHRGDTRFPAKSADMPPADMPPDDSTESTGGRLGDSYRGVAGQAAIESRVTAGTPRAHLGQGFAEPHAGRSHLLLATVGTLRQRTNIRSTYEQVSAPSSGCQKLVPVYLSPPRSITTTIINPPPPLFPPWLALLVVYGALGGGLVVSIGTNKTGPCVPKPLSFNRHHHHQSSSLSSPLVPPWSSSGEVSGGLIFSIGTTRCFAWSECVIASLASSTFEAGTIRLS